MSTFNVTIDGKEFEVELRLNPQGGELLTALVDGEEIAVEVPNLNTAVPALEWILVDEKPYEVAFDDNMNWIRAYTGLHQILVRDSADLRARPRGGDGRVKAPIPGLITRVLVEEGQQVEANQPLLVLEAMKMENEIRAPFEGTIRSVSAEPGQSVLRNDVVVEIT